MRKILINYENDWFTCYILKADGTYIDFDGFSALEKLLAWLKTHKITMAEWANMEMV